VSDHAIALAQELESTCGIQSAFVVVNSNERNDVSYPVAFCAPDRLLESCTSLGSGGPAAILLHLSGYGYSPDGAPAELAEAVAGIRADGRFRVAVFCHELFAGGMPWTSAFWFSHRQQKAVRKIVEQSELILTNTQDSFAWLNRVPVLRQGASVDFLPVFSTIGEARRRTPLAERRRDLAVFGLPGSRQRAFQALARLAATLKELRVEAIVDIGTEFDGPAEIAGIPIRRTGLLDAADLAAELSKTMFGFLSLPWKCLTKSSIFAAYCAQGTIPLLNNPLPAVVDGLEDGIHVLSPKTAAAVLSEGLERCSIEVWRWYAGHGLHAHATVYAHWLAQPQPEFTASGTVSSAR